MDTPADIVMELFGGEKNVAKICNTHISNVYRWRYPKDKKGTGGTVPGRHHVTLLMAAKEQGVPLEPSHLIPKPPTDEPPPGLRDERTNEQSAH